jgi:DNA repair photolyase
MLINEVKCKSILTKSGISSIDYAINPYYGCAHKCQYCYAVFMKRFTGHTEPWGEFVDVKINAPEVLARQAKRVKTRSRISFGTVCDPYQPLELKYQITRQCLEILEPYRHSLSILTKSTIVVRDIDILKALHKVKVTFTITTLDERIRQIFEPGAPPTEQRFKALRTLSHKGIRTGVFAAPVLPYLSDSTKALDHIFKAAKLAGAESIMFDTLNPYPRVWRNVRKLIKTHFPEAIEQYDYFYEHRRMYKIRLRKRIAACAAKHNMESSTVF